MSESRVCAANRSADNIAGGRKENEENFCEIFFCYSLNISEENLEKISRVTSERIEIRFMKIIFTHFESLAEMGGTDRDRWRCLLRVLMSSRMNHPLVASER